MKPINANPTYPVPNNSGQPRTLYQFDSKIRQTPRIPFGITRHLDMQEHLQERRRFTRHVMCVSCFFLIIRFMNVAQIHSGQAHSRVASQFCRLQSQVLRSLHTSLWGAEATCMEIGSFYQLWYCTHQVKEALSQLPLFVFFFPTYSSFLSPPFFIFYQVISRAKGE